MAAALLLAGGCHRASGVPDAAPTASETASDAAADAKMDASAADVAPDAAADAGGDADAGAVADAAVARKGPCGRCRADEYCEIVEHSGGVQRATGPSGFARHSCRKLPACAHPSCACFAFGTNCSVVDGQLRVTIRVLAPGRAGTAVPPR